MHLLHRSSNLTVLCLFRIPPLQTKHCMRTVWMLNNPWWGKALTDQHGQKPSIKRDSRGHSVNSTKTGRTSRAFLEQNSSQFLGSKEFWVDFSVSASKCTWRACRMLQHLPTLRLLVQMEAWPRALHQHPTNRTHCNFSVIFPNSGGRIKYSGVSSISVYTSCLPLFLLRINCLQALQCN